MQKIVVLNLIKRMYPAADHVLIDIPGNTIHARCTKDSSKDITRTIETESQYLPLLADAYEIENLTKIEIDLTNRKVKFIGNKIVTI